MANSKPNQKLFFSKPIIFWLLVFIAILGLFLRFYNLPHLFFYTMDEEVMNLIQRRIVLGEHFPLIGSVSPLGTYLGPIFYYFGALILWISNLNPLGQGFFAAMLGTANIFLIYLVAKNLFNKTVGILSAIFYSSSFLMVIFDRRYWHLTPGPILSLLVLFSLFKIKSGQIKYVYLLVAALIFGWNTDYTNLVLFLFTFIMWLVLKLPVRRKEVLIAVLIFLVSNLPLLAFDLRHNFLNAHNFVSYLTTHRASQLQPEGGDIVKPEKVAPDRQTQVMQTAILPIIVFSRAIYTASDLNIPEQHTYCKEYIKDRNNAQGLILPGLALLILVGFFILMIRRKKDKQFISYLLVGSFYLIFQLGVLFYAFVFKGDVFEHYMSTLLPYFFIILAIVTAYLMSTKLKALALASVALFLIGNINLILHAYNPLGFDDKMSAARYALTQVGEKPYSLDTLSSCYRWDGFYYPLLLQGSHPVKSYQDPNYSWLYNYEVADKHPDKIVVEVPRGKLEDQKFEQNYQRYQQWVVSRQKFDDLEVLILDNRKGDFH